MKAFQFPLDKVLHIREKELEILNAEWLMIRREVEVQEEQLNTLDQHLQELTNKKNQRMLGAISGFELKQFTQSEQAIRLLRKEKVNELRQLHQKLDMALVKRNQKKQEVSGLTKLKEKKQLEHEDKVRKFEEATIESQWLMNMNVR